MENTGVFASTEEIEFLTKKATIARNTPAFGLSSEQVLSGKDFASMAHMDASQACHKIALNHGLPEVNGWYGIDLKTGEFLKFRVRRS